jgi:hypothetical protein
MKEKKPFKCDICDEENKPFKSNSCGASFARNTFESSYYFSSCRKEAFQMLHLLA